LLTLQTKQTHCNMEIEIKHGTETVICLSGQLDTLSSPDLEKEITAILEGDAKKVILDGSKLTYISSAGLRLLLILQKRMSQKGGKFVLRNIQDSIMEIFRITGFISFLTIE
jgi:anti-anti-sigma factor